MNLPICLANMGLIFIAEFFTIIPDILSDIDLIAEVVSGTGREYLKIAVCNESAR